ncbi:metallophosphoesterase family protein [Dongshaea marina]|uniref:metallophosphoesterase family protein n=1 Tax=Dongshaea marina TaxID=2047966 RepID=UPI000D3EC2FE|nr:metallophosphoesterase family protein [Dongshaea marina]
MRENAINIDYSEVLGRKIAVLSDIHSNSDSLEFAINYIKKNSIKYIVILGDVLSYGCQCKEVIYSLKNIPQETKCFFIKGNHDQIYFDLQNGKSLENISGYIRDSIMWNLNNIDVNLYSYFNWIESLSIGPILFSHANPYSDNDWSYINSRDDLLSAAKELSNRHYMVGIFGHTHRALSTCVINHNSIKENTKKFKINDKKEKCLIVNPGSLGQSRGTGLSFLILTLGSIDITIEHIEAKTDLNDYFRKINASQLPKETIQKLLSFFKE